MYDPRIPINSIWINNLQGYWVGILDCTSDKVTFSTEWPVKTITKDRSVFLKEFHKMET